MAGASTCNRHGSETLDGPECLPGGAGGDRGEMTAVMECIAGAVLWANLPVPVYWLVMHTGVGYWRRHARAGYTTAIVAGWGSATVLAWFYAGRLLDAAAASAIGKLAGVALIAFDAWVILQVERQLGVRRMVGQVELENGRAMKRDGMYARVRHPRYAAMLISTLGACLIAARPAMWGVAAIWALVVGLMVRAEERELVARFGGEYEEYRRRVPAIIPRIGE